MYIITVAGQEEKGASPVYDDVGVRIIYIFQEEDDATRYSLLLESTGAPEMNVMEVEDELILRTCDIHNYKYSIITPNDMVIPPKDTHDFI